jgi:starch-binding outer membrane protein, SusD/RagB family
MKKNIFYISVLSFVMMITSCNKDGLSPIPTTSISDASAFASSDRISGMVKSIYGNMRAGSFYGGRYTIYNDIRADDFINELTNVVTGYDVWNGTQNNSSTNSVVSLWSQAYYTINLCNVFLDGMNGGGNTVVGTALAANYAAEARLVRAMSYYALLQLYARPYADGNGSKPGLPIRLTGNTGSGSYNLARSTVADVYAQVLADLNYAETNLPLTYTAPIDRVTRAHRNTAIAFKTRVYLSMQKYAEVITEANKIVSATAPFTAATGATFALQADITNVFKAPYLTSESILSMPFNGTTETPGGQNQLGYYYGVAALNGGNGEYSLNPSGIIADAGWLATDKRRSLIFTAASTKRYLSKYTSVSPFTDYAPVMRYSEVLLNLAEARVRTTNALDVQAIALLNAVRGRSDATTIFTVASFAGSTDLINAILKERRIEFLGEGLRSPDLLRLLQTIPAKSSAQAGNVAAIAPTAQNYIWPISATELQLNKLMTDN